MSFPRLLEKNAFKKGSFFFEQVSSNRKVNVLLDWLTRIIQLFCMLFQNLYLILITIRFVKEGSIVWEMLSRFLTCLSLALSFNYAVFKYKTIANIENENHRIVYNLNREKITMKKFPSAALFLIAGTLFVVFSVSTVAISFLTWSGKGKPMEDRDFWVKTFCSVGICDYGTLNEANKNKIFYIDLFFYTLATVASGVFLNMIYSYNCLIIISFSESTLSNLKKQCKAQLEEPLTRDFILKYREYSQDIKNLLRLCNDVFSGMFVIWYGASLICTCDFLSRSIKNTEQYQPLQITGYFFIYGQSFVSVILVSFVSSKLPNVCNKAFVKLQSLTMKKKNVSLDVYAELNILLSQVQAHPTGVEIGGCFLITKAFFVSYLGTIITFLMITVQLQNK